MLGVLDVSVSVSGYMCMCVVQARMEVLDVSVDMSVDTCVKVIYMYA